MNLVVVMTDRPASEGMRSWFDAANTRAPPSVHRVSLISLNLPFFVSDSTARRKARDNVPEQYWSDSFLDKDARMAKTLDLPKSREPFVFVVDAQGRIVETAHGLPTDPGAERIWRSLDMRA
jgi:hypothetical protein